MWELTKRISLGISSVLPKMEPEPDLYTGSDPDQKAKSTGSAILHLVAYIHRGHRRLSCTLQTEKRRPAILLTADSWPATSADLPHNVAHCRDIPPCPPPHPPTSPPHWSWDRKGGMKKKKMKKIVNVSVAYLPFLYAFFVWHGNKSGLVLCESGGRFL